MGRLAEKAAVLSLHTTCRNQEGLENVVTRISRNTCVHVSTPVVTTKLV